MMFCPKCGTQNADDATFCSKCGNLLQQSAERPAAAAGVSTGAAEEERLMKCLIGKNAEYYMQKRGEMAKKGTKISWNWAAFFFNILWLIYRKQYWQGIGLLAINIVLNSLLPGIWSIVSGLITGLLGNYLYIRYIDNCYATAASMEPATRDAYVAKHGGTIF